MKMPTIEELSKEVKDRAMSEIVINGKTLRKAIDDGDIAVVVRCKDCKHKDGCRTAMVRQKSDWYCADGERITE